MSIWGARRPGGWSSSEAIALVRLGGGCECSYRPMGALMHLLGNSHPFLAPTVTLPVASAASPAILVSVRGFHGGVVVLQVVAVFKLIGRCMSRDRSLPLELPQQLFVQLLWHEVMDHLNDAIHLRPHVRHLGTAGLGSGLLTWRENCCRVTGGV